MRISDWSSDVCSSDLRNRHALHRAAHAPPGLAGQIQRTLARALRRFGIGVRFLLLCGRTHCGAGRAHRHAPALGTLSPSHHLWDRTVGTWDRRRALHLEMAQMGRSEEHTSELQSLMRISYAVFCLKKK